MIRTVCVCVRTDEGGKKKEKEREREGGENLLPEKDAESGQRWRDALAKALTKERVMP